MSDSVGRDIGDFYSAIAKVSTHQATKSVCSLRPYMMRAAWHSPHVYVDVVGRTFLALSNNEVSYGEVLTYLSLETGYQDDSVSELRSSTDGSCKISFGRVADSVYKGSVPRPDMSTFS